ncbi:exopolyphosphatase, partial [Rhizobium ruizarguesonis]
GQTAAGRKAFAEAHDAGESVDDAELTGTGRLGNEETAIVGAEIKSGVELLRPHMLAANHINHWTSLPVGVVTLSERHGG